jgi:hypothetical protein
MADTTRDEIDIDLDGSITKAINKLTKLKKLYPKGQIRLTNEYEYGESYAKLKLEFVRAKDTAEREFDKWQAKLRQLDELRAAARAFKSEGVEYPRIDEIAALEKELGAWAKGRRLGGLTIIGNDVYMHDMMLGAFDREGSWAFKTMMHPDLRADWGDGPIGEDIAALEDDGRARD